jgi:alanyl-tRNA synthetase
MTGNEARKLFIEYFKKHNHHEVRSSSLIPHDDPTLLFVNAGMVQFKRIFIGEEKREYSMATTSQKCVRAGGKHNDLENVGYTARHHTFFEMLGNFSFGKYFKDEAIEFAWDLLTNGYKLPVDKLWISIYLDDDEAFEIWNKKIGVSEDKIVRLGEEENFWSMGDTGPCGPCSEIHIDRGEEFGCDSDSCAVGCDCDRYLEIWNLVFMQFNKDESGNMEPLPKPSIDTGMGLERILSVIQDTKTNYETDLFIPIIETVERLSGKKLGDSDEIDVAMKVIADHSRAASFLIGDGILPSNEGRGYVLRRIMRRAIRYGRNLELTKPFLHETAETVFEVMKEGYPELFESKAFILNAIKNEEERFSATLDRGLKILNDTLDEMKSSGNTVIPGDVIFKLYDTFGFPVDIIKDIVKGSDITLDITGYEEKMEEQRQKGGGKTSFEGLSEAFKKLSSEGVKTVFKGYEETSCSSDILAMVSNGNEVESAQKGEKIELVVRETSFYAESGGQAGDSGEIEGDGFLLNVSDTLKDPTGLFIHICEVKEGVVKKGDGVKLTANLEKREATELNHTATHILHSALRELLGDHVKQAGSLVTHDRLRFDFSHFSNVDREKLDGIESYVNAKIRENVSVDSIEMSAEEAFKTGATALFEEKYGDTVRVVSLAPFSKEFCGGTHTGRTGNIGYFRILSEVGIAAGVRRIEALTGPLAIDHMHGIYRKVTDISNIVKTTPDKLVERIDNVVSEHKTSLKELEKLKASLAAKSAENIEDDIKEINGIKVVAKKVEVEKPAELRDLADKFKDKIKSGIVVLGAESDGKALLIAIVTKDLTDKYKAGNIIKEVAAVVGGGGGGRPDMAQAGGSDPSKLDEALAKVEEILS